MATSVLLQSCFRLLPGKELFEVRLTSSTLVYQQTSNNSCCRKRTLPLFSINLNDIYGAKVFKKNTQGDTNAYLHIFTCPLKGKRRIRNKICFKVDGWKDVEGNIGNAELWAKTISWLIRDSDFDFDTIKDKSLPPKRKLLVLVNPCSGSGKSLKIFNNHVAPMLRDAAIDFTVLITEYAGHAQQIAINLKTEDWDGIVICSGDGLVHELINGLMKRSDWKTAIKMPLGVIPTGSGNALCYSALYEAGEPFDLTAAIHAVLCGQSLDLDICTIETPSQKMFSFLSVTWGMISDVDIESEKYRCLGNARFTIGAIIRILNLRRYHGKISYLPFDDDVEQVEGSGENAGGTEQDDNEWSSYSLQGSPSGSFLHVNPVQEEKPMLLTSQDNVGMLTSSNPSVNDVSNQGNIHQLQCTLPSLMKKLPSNWRTVEGNFILGSSVLLSHLDANCRIAPHAKLSDGSLNIGYIKSGVSKSRLVSIIGELETGAQVDSAEFVSIKARAFRLEPDLSQKGTLAVDGERLPYSAVQGEIHKGLAKVMCRRQSSQT